VAAYIVEKLSGEPFEDFVTSNLFLPIGMTSATYFPPASSAGATQYRHGGTSPYPYWHMLFRPSGALNASDATWRATFSSSWTAEYHTAGR
jgi:CubicO group peptidase (beta-lactamase class C family)